MKRSGKSKSILIRQAKWRKRKEHLKVAGILSVLLICLAVIVGGGYYLIQDKVSHAETADVWDNWDLAKMEKPNNQSSQTLTTARATFYDIYSDSQVWNGAYRSSLGSITDANSTGKWTDNANTFSHFNRYLSTSTNENGYRYMDMHQEPDSNGKGFVYPLYCGLMYPGMSAGQMWGYWSGETDPVYGWWYAYANCNQYDNKNNTMDDHGVATTINGGVAQGLVNDKLDSDGNITMGKGEYERVVPYFDSEFLNTPYETGKVTLGTSLSNVAFPFHKGKTNQKVYLTSASGEEENEGYYYFDSYHDVLQLNRDTKNVTYYYDENHVYDTEGKRGFFPYNKSGDTNEKLNYVFGVKMELNFNMTSDGKIKGEDILFEFNGDDDLWVFVDGYLVLDIGGAHIPVHGTINFAEKKATVDKVKPNPKDVPRNLNLGGGFTQKVYDFGKGSAGNAKELYNLLSDTTRNHTLTIFYMERGKANSNLKIKFNLPQITTLSVGDEVDDSNVNKALRTDALWKACDNHYFKYQLENKGTLLDSDYNNSITAALTPAKRTTFTPVGLTEKYRKKMTSQDSATQRLRFYTFTGTNYYSMVVGGTSVTLPTLTSSDGNGQAILDADGCAVIDGTKYVFMGWTTDETYRDNWEKIKNNTYIGGMPGLVSADSVTVTEDTDYYAVWAKKSISVSYYDETNVDVPLGYDYAGSDTVWLIQKVENAFTMKKDTRAVSFWGDSDVSGIWKTDGTRKGFQLNGWRLYPAKSDGENTLLCNGGGEAVSYVPLCDVKLYADWSRTCYRARFQTQTKEGTEGASDTENWTSNIVYFPIGYTGYLPYINDTSEKDSFLETVAAENGDTITCFDFTSMARKENYGIVQWTEDDTDQTTYRTVNYEENGRTLYRQKWMLKNRDVIFTGNWKKVIGKITFQAGTLDGNALGWDDVNITYKVGETVNKPELSVLWGDKSVQDGWVITGWKNGEKIIDFPYVMTEEDLTLTAVWEKTSSSVTYRFADTEKGISGTTADGKTSYKKFYANDASIELLTLEGMGSFAPIDTLGTKDKVTHYVKGKDGKAYVITGWKYEDGTLVKDTDSVKGKNLTVTAVWEEATTKLKVSVKVNTNEQKEWDSDKAKENGWTEKESSGGKTWILEEKLVPGEKFSSYVAKDGSLYHKLYAADTAIGENDLEHFKTLQYGGLNYAGGTVALDDAEAVVPYTVSNHTVNLTGNLKQEKILLTFVSVNSASDADETGEGAGLAEKVLGYQVYSVSDGEMALPKVTDALLNENGQETEHAITAPDGYHLAGWKCGKEGSAVASFVPESTFHNSTWYAVWEADVQGASLDESVNAFLNKTINNQSQKNSLRTMAFRSSNEYAGVASEFYDLNDLLTSKAAAEQTTADGAFYLTYDQVASFLNCFTTKREGVAASTMHLSEQPEIYSKTDKNTVKYDESAYRNMYETTWELRDIHGYISNRNNNTDLKNMPMSESGATKVYDGRVTGEKTGAFSFANENDATGASYATNLRALFTHTIQTGDITITKKLTSSAGSVARRKKDTDQEFAFKVYFYHMFGDETDTEEQLYKGEYKKLDVYGNYVRENGQVKTYTATGGKILVKTGETAIITGIPVLTEYRIEEEKSVRKSGTYLLSTAKEITVRGSVKQDKKYAVSDETVEKYQNYLLSYNGESADTPVYSKELRNNSGTLEGKKLNDFTQEQLESINCSFTGKILTKGYTYNYVATNDVLLNGVSLYVDKIIDEFYYDENDRFTEDKTYNELTHGSKQTFVFHVKYTKVNDTGSVESGTTTDTFQECLTFDPADDTLEKVKFSSEMQSFANSSHGWKKGGVVIGLEQGYYEIYEDEDWSWKYDLMGIYETPYAAHTGSMTPLYVAGSREAAKGPDRKGADKKVYRFYIRGKEDKDANITTDSKGTWKTYNGKAYRVLENVEDPTVTFVNLKATDQRTHTKGDTDIAVNEIAVPTPTPEPNQYNGISVDTDKQWTLTRKGNTGVTESLPEIKAQKTDGTIVSIPNNDSNLAWSIESGSDCIQLTGTTLVPLKAGSATVKAIYQDSTIAHELTFNVKVEQYYLITIYYKNANFTTVNMRYKMSEDGTNYGKWSNETTGDPTLEGSDRSDYTWKRTIDLGADTIKKMRMCFYSGGSWDNNGYTDGYYETTDLEGLWSDSPEINIGISGPGSHTVPTLLD